MEHETGGSAVSSDDIGAVPKHDGSERCEPAGTKTRVPSGLSSDPLTSAGLERIAQGIELLRDSGTESLTDDTVRDSVRTVFELMCSLESEWLELIAELDRRPEAVEGADAGRTAVTFLTEALKRSRGQAYRDVKAARTVAPDGGVLPRLGEAFAQGRVSRSHVDVAARTLNRLPEGLIRRRDPDGTSGIQRVDTFLADNSRILAPAKTDRLARQLLAVLDPEGEERFDPLSYTRREHTFSIDGTGMLVGRYQLDPVSAAQWRAALARFSRPAPTAAVRSTDGESVIVRDDRTHAQRMADAMIAMAREASGNEDTVRRPISQIMVVATTDQLAAATKGPEHEDHGPGRRMTAAAEGPGSGNGTGPFSGLASCSQTGAVSASVLERLSCDSVLRRVLLSPSGGVLDLGRAVRTATWSQRVALIARDQGCVIPGCAAPVDRCDVHHVVPWQTGGRSDLDNLVLACHHHHTALHSGIWRLQIREGAVWAIPPAWVDPRQRAVRNPVPRGLKDAEAIARRMTRKRHVDPSESHAVQGCVEGPVESAKAGAPERSEHFLEEPEISPTLRPGLEPPPWS